MHSSCRSVDASFLDSAPMRFASSVDLEASPSKVFAILADADSWPKWFHAMHKVVWTSEKPYGVGSTRTVSMTGWLDIDERYFRWEKDRRCSYYVTATSMPMAHAMAENYLLEETAPGKTRFTHIIALDPRFLVEVGGPFTHLFFESQLKGSGKSLQSYVLQA